MHNAGITCGNSYYAQIGKLKHAEYMKDLANGTSKVKEFVLKSGKRIDYVDFENGFVHELKPNNPRAIARGLTQLKGYIAELSANPKYAGIPWKAVLDLY